MALFHSFSSFSLLFFFFVTLFSISYQQPVLNSAEQDSVYQVLDSINSDIPWRSLFPGDLCSSAPHGVVCDYFSETTSNDSSSVDTVHVVELNFGYVSDYTPNPPCSPNSTLSPLLFTSFKYLRKLFFYKCFTDTRVVSVPDITPSFVSTLEELVLVDNPSLVGPIGWLLCNLTNIRRAIVTGNGVDGKIPDGIGGLVNLAEFTLSRNRLSGEMPLGLSKLKKLKVLDLSHNYLDGNVPESMGNLTELLKLDLSYNELSGKIPESLKAMQKLEFLDLSFNRFGNFGVPLFLSEMLRLREVYLSGNQLGGKIPENLWNNLGGVTGIGFSDMGLVGSIPATMGLHLRNLCFLGIDNNKLEGTVPEEFGLLEFINEINLENNRLSGRVPFSAKLSVKMGQKLKLAGNPELCVDEGLRSLKNSSSLGKLKVCKKPYLPNPVIFCGDSSAQAQPKPRTLPSMFMIIGLLFIFMCQLDF
ncbi:piriformospora indica-insensitive protein 2 [Ziziphus jujuba]|uniref:Piriformospora indica-insensitive protein 2 n=1 Tax=Ziziphus jujuba TaxID=326968 RepID=A0A6P3Z720_ZIZJJ|nr:piriformospora indica-insensitive protein 2 [Ziziphus jujuba]